MAAPSIVSVDMRIIGDLKSDGDVQVDGTVDGDIQSSSLSIGKTAEVNGSVEAESVKVWGRVNGRIHARQVTLLESAEVTGDVIHETLEVARGASVDGLVKRDRSPSQKQTEDRPAVNLVVTDSDHAAPEKSGDRQRSPTFPLKPKSKAAASALIGTTGSSSTSAPSELTDGQ